MCVVCTADILAHAFDVLKVELKSEVSKELFLYYQATPIVTHYLKPTNKVKVQHDTAVLHCCREPVCSPVEFVACFMS